MAGSKLIINHQVMMAGSKGHASIGRSRLLYIANRPGAVSLKSEDDLRMAQENERMAKLGYIAYRPGSVPEKSSRHALFNQNGIPVRAEIKKELTTTSSAIITTVVAVRREDAEELRLTTKQDWERMLRGNWQKYIETMGVMEPQNVRWVAAFHVNQENNLHCHVLTWDASGAYNSLLPRKSLTEANDALRAQVLKPQREAVSMLRTQARDELAAAMRNAEIEVSVRECVRHSLPQEGSLKYAKLARSAPGAVAAVDAAINETLKSSPQMQELLAQYRSAVLEHGKLRELSPDKLELHAEAAENDLRRRLGNALIANVRGDTPRPADVDRPVHTEHLASGEADMPTLRRQAQTIREELSSCLRPSDQRHFAEALWSEAHGQPRLSSKEISEAVSEAPTLRARMPQLVAGAAANATRIARTLASAAVQPSSESDAGDEIGRMAISLGTRATAQAVSFALKHAPRQCGTAQRLEPQKLSATMPIHPTSA